MMDATPNLVVEHAGKRFEFRDGILQSIDFTPTPLTVSRSGTLAWPEFQERPSLAPGASRGRECAGRVTATPLLDTPVPGPLGGFSMTSKDVATIVLGLLLGVALGIVLIAISH